MDICFYCGVEGRPIYKYGGKGEPICTTCIGLSHPPREVVASLGRNEKCYCGSGKKFKTCCLKKEATNEQ